MAKYKIGTLLRDTYFEGDKQLFYIKQTDHDKETGELNYYIHYYDDGEDSFYAIETESSLFNDFRLFVSPVKLWVTLNA